LFEQIKTELNKSHMQSGEAVCEVGGMRIVHHQKMAA